MVIVELCEEVVEFRRVLGFEGAYHSCLEKLAEGLGLLHRRQHPQAPADLVLVHAPFFHMNRLQNNEGAGEIASLFDPATGCTIERVPSDLNEICSGAGTVVTRTPE
jgi:hypothetical protein